jgi:hypothetical protein
MLDMHSSSWRLESFLSIKAHPAPQYIDPYQLLPTAGELASVLFYGSVGVFLADEIG